MKPMTPTAWGRWVSFALACALVSSAVQAAPPPEVSQASAVAIGQTAVAATFGAASFVDAEPYLAPDGSVCVYALEFSGAGSNVTVLVSARRDDVPVIMMWRGLPRHKDPGVLAAASLAVEDQLGVQVLLPRRVYWLDLYEVWAEYPQQNPQTGGPVLCNLYTRQVGAPAALDGKWQNRMQHVERMRQEQAAATTFGVAADAAPARADYINALWGGVDAALTGTAPAATAGAAAAPDGTGTPPWVTRYISGVPNINQGPTPDCAVVASLDVMLYWDTRGFGRLIDYGNINQARLDLRRALGYTGYTTYDSKQEPGVRAFANAKSYFNQYNFWVSMVYHPTFAVYQTEINAKCPTVLILHSYTDSPRNPTDDDWGDHSVCGVGYYSGALFGTAKTQWAIIHDNWFGGDYANPYRIDDEPYVDFSRIQDLGGCNRIEPDHRTGSAVTYPSYAGITWKAGKTQFITWRGFSGSAVSVRLLNNGANVQTIRSSAPNAKAGSSIAWTIPDNLVNGSLYTVRIGNGVTTDDSDYPFTISGCAPRVTYPSAAGIKWHRGDAVTIQWVNMPGSYVKIGLYRGTTLVRQITDGTVNSGACPWSVPPDQAIASDYRIRVTALSDATQRDYSNNPFRIAAGP